ncbi:hypothetical protein PAXRUDRAFT_833038, partial [Paxillus rubicundulus Ve08.2h10]
MSGYYIFRSLPCPRWQVPRPSDDPPTNHLAEQLAMRERDCIATVNPFSRTESVLVTFSRDEDLCREVG